MRSKKQQSVEVHTETSVDENIAVNSKTTNSDKHLSKKRSSSGSSDKPSKKRSSTKDGSGSDMQIEEDRCTKKKKRVSHGKKSVPESPTDMQGIKPMSKLVNEVIETTVPSSGKTANEGKWRSKYEALRQSKNEEMDGVLAKMEEHTQQGQQAQKSLVQHLNSEVERLTNEVCVLNSNAAETLPDVADQERAAALEQQNTDLRAQLEEQKQAKADSANEKTNETNVDAEEFAAQKQMLAMYRRLTGLQFSFVQEDEEQEQEQGGERADSAADSSRLICTAVNRATQKAAKFELIVPASMDEEVEYLPVKNTHILPAFAQDEICFDQKMAPVFVSKIVNSLFRQQ
jgi:hypothetical protein